MAKNFEIQKISWLGHFDEQTTPKRDREPFAPGSPFFCQEGVVHLYLFAFTKHINSNRRSLPAKLKPLSPMQQPDKMP
jgi:hypothetical protein